MGYAIICSRNNSSKKTRNSNNTIQNMTPARHINIYKNIKFCLKLFICGFKIIPILYLKKTGVNNSLTKDKFRNMIADIFQWLINSFTLRN